MSITWKQVFIELICKTKHFVIPASDVSAITTILLITYMVVFINLHPGVVNSGLTIRITSVLSHAGICVE